LFNPKEISSFNIDLLNLKGRKYHNQNSRSGKIKGANIENRYIPVESHYAANFIQKLVLFDA
jgi:hypothetical protein